MDIQNDYIRGPFLAIIEIERRRRLHGKADDGKFMEALLNYFHRFSHLSSFTSDVEMFLCILTETEKAKLLEKFVNIMETSSTSPVKVLGQAITIFKIQELFGIMFTLPIRELEGIAKGMVEMYCKNLILSTDLDPQENMHGEELLSVASNVLVLLFWRTKKLGYLLEATMVLEFGLNIRRDVWQYKVPLLHLYSHMGALPLAYEWFIALEVKNILLETNFHHILTDMLKSPHWLETADLLKEYLKFMDDHLREAADLTFLAYRHRNYSKVIEFVKFKERFQHSDQLLMARLEAFILQLKQKADNLEEVEGILENVNYGIQLLELSNEDNLKSLTFNGYFQARPWWSPTPDINYLSEPFEEGSACLREKSYRHKVGEKEWIVRKHIETKSLIPRLVYLSIRSSSSSLKENLETNVSTAVIIEMKCLLERYASNIGLPFDDAIDVILGIAKGQKSFKIQQTPVKRLCKTHKIITVNGQYPGPTLEVRDGDTLVINAVNRAKYNITLHWHGVHQNRTGWADGPEYLTQCPIMPAGSYTYRFTIENQEGTLWWHAHSSWLRATVHGALIIYPKEGSHYPFPKPNKEIPVILGEWWNRNPIDVLRQAMKTGAAPNISDAFLINGQPGDLYNCSREDTTVIPVASGETNLLRIVNAALNNELFFTIAGHKMTVVAADAAYTKPFTTSVLKMGPGETTDVLVTTNQPRGRYYIAARAFATAQGVPFDNTTTTAILEYNGNWPTTKIQAGTPPKFPVLPAFNDTATAAAYDAGIKSPHRINLPGPVDEYLFYTVGLGLFNCPPEKQCGGPNNTRFGASMNNVSFTFPRYSILEAYYQRKHGVFAANFPAIPPVQFDYTAKNISRALQQPARGTRLYPLKYGSVVQLVMQGTNIFAGEEHPMHIHGYQFYILAAGFGNFDPRRDTARFNLVDPPLRNTVGVPVNGWAVIRFVANNPGVWLVHCHLDVHLTWGLATAFLVENGVGELQSLEPPPADLPKC